MKGGPRRKPVRRSRDPHMTRERARIQERTSRDLDRTARAELARFRRAREADQ